MRFVVYKKESGQLIGMYAKESSAKAQVTKHNKKLFFSVNWQNNIIKEFKQNFESAMSQLTATGKYQKEMERLALSDPIIAHNRSTDSPLPGGPTIECRQKLAQWLKAKNSLT